MKRFVLAAVFVFLASMASAQSVTFPGSMWSTFGTAGAIAETGNVTSRMHAEQGIAKGAFSVVGEVTGVKDKLDYDWNNSALFGVLGRYTLKLPGGQVRGNVGYEREQRFVMARTLSGFVWSVDCWFGWNIK